MTLKEYVKQKDPERMPDVILKESEVNFIDTKSKFTGGTVKYRVYIKTPKNSPDP